MNKLIVFLLLMSIPLSFHASFKDPNSYQDGMQSAVYGPVKYNETLWDIIKQVMVDHRVTKTQYAVAILRKNPDAFNNNNINALIENSRLMLPSYAEVSAVPAEEADKIFLQQWEEWKYLKQNEYLENSTNTDRPALSVDTFNTPVMGDSVYRTDDLYNAKSIVETNNQRIESLNENNVSSPDMPVANSISQEPVNSNANTSLFEQRQIKSWLAIYGTDLSKFDFALYGELFVNRSVALYHQLPTIDTRSIEDTIINRPIETMVGLVGFLFLIAFMILRRQIRAVSKETDELVLAFTSNHPDRVAPSFNSRVVDDLDIATEIEAFDAPAFSDSDFQVLESYESAPSRKVKRSPHAQQKPSSSKTAKSTRFKEMLKAHEKDLETQKTVDDVPMNLGSDISDILAATKSMSHQGKQDTESNTLFPQDELDHGHLENKKYDGSSRLEKAFAGNFGEKFDALQDMMNNYNKRKQEAFNTKSDAVSEESTLDLLSGKALTLIDKVNNSEFVDEFVHLASRQNVKTFISEITHLNGKLSELQKLINKEPSDLNNINQYMVTYNLVKRISAIFGAQFIYEYANLILQVLEMISGGQLVVKKEVLNLLNDSISGNREMIRAIIEKRKPGAQVEDVIRNAGALVSGYQTIPIAS